MKNTIVTLLFCFSLISTLQAAPIWKASGPGEFYFFGTFHLLRESDHPLPEVFQRTFEQCDRLWFETDLNALAEPEILLQVQEAMRLPAGTLLNDVLSPEAFADLKAAAAQEQLPLAILLPLKPWAAGVVLSTTAMSRLGFQPEYGIDTYLHRQAEQQGLPVAYLEDPLEQFQFLNQAGDMAADEFIEQTLTEMSNIETLMSDMVAAWKAGDLSTLNDVGALDQYPGLEEILLHQRNRNWLAILLGLQDSPGTECVAVGALHLSGEQGLLNAFESAGYRISQQ